MCAVMGTTTVTLLELINTTSTNSSPHFPVKDSNPEGDMSANNNYYTIVLVGCGLAIYLVLYVRRKRKKKKYLQRREEEYLRYYHSILPRSKIYGEEANANSIKNLATMAESIQSKQTGERSISKGLANFAGLLIPNSQLTSMQIAMDQNGNNKSADSEYCTIDERETIETTENIELEEISLTFNNLTEAASCSEEKKIIETSNGVESQSVYAKINTEARKGDTQTSPAQKIQETHQDVFTISKEIPTEKNTTATSVDIAYNSGKREVNTLKKYDNDPTCENTADTDSTESAGVWNIDKTCDKLGRRSSIVVFHNDYLTGTWI